ncbi:hypothetical protein Y032_0060g3095 [Ancylostoma ceylanicum]|nr:hypothetical protein Y032_0060g3095 [Ancylostoma ceylanicum]
MFQSSHCLGLSIWLTIMRKDCIKEIIDCTDFSEITGERWKKAFFSFLETMGPDGESLAVRLTPDFQSFLYACFARMASPRIHPNRIMVMQIFAPFPLNALPHEI